MAAKTAVKKAAKTKKVTFSLNAPEAKRVSVAGDFNGWDESAGSLKKQKDVWKREFELKPGRYEYKFVVDGNWIADPSNEKKVTSSIGTENSLLEI